MLLEPPSQESQDSRKPSSGFAAEPADRVGELGVTVEASVWEAAALSDDGLARVGPSNFGRARVSA